MFKKLCYKYKILYIRSTIQPQKTIKPLKTKNYGTKANVYHSFQLQEDNDQR